MDAKYLTIVKLLHHMVKIYNPLNNDHHWGLTSWEN